VHLSTACRRQVVEGLTGFSSMSMPCFSTRAFALLASIESKPRFEHALLGEFAEAEKIQ
jgi:hypothetical protein